MLSPWGRGAELTQDTRTHGSPGLTGHPAEAPGQLPPWMSAPQGGGSERGLDLAKITEPQRALESRVCSGPGQTWACPCGGQTWHAWDSSQTT